jgi:type I restriction enzyme M protein
LCKHARLSIKQGWRKQKNYNLDFKSPHVVDIEHGDPDELIKEFEAISKQLVATRDMLKKELLQTLGGGM